MAGLKLPTSGDLPTSASQSAGIMVCFLKGILDRKLINRLIERFKIRVATEKSVFPCSVGTFLYSKDIANKLTVQQISLSNLLLWENFQI